MPILYITSEDIKKAIDSAEYFASQFMKAGYVSVTASGFVSAKLAGIQYIPLGGLHRLYSLCRADLILYASEYKECLDSPNTTQMIL